MYSELEGRISRHKNDGHEMTLIAGPACGEYLVAVMPRYAIAIDIIPSLMSIAPGTRIGPYEVASRIGEGGMGIVYQARDTQLQRNVALKVLPDHFSSDPERLDRFQREAQVLASLNHPNIAHIYGLERSAGSGCIVMELVEGATLAERIQRGPIPVEDAVEIARQIVDALEAAHERGIIHRDLKPANIKIAPNGMVKVLDFGLAKVVEPAPAAEAATRMSVSAPGMIVGTAAYMSPEQARGRSIDARTDIWAFGCVLYEMLTGRPAFDGDTVTDIIAKVIQSEPQWQLLAAAVPASIRMLLESALTKDPKQRLQQIGDARLFLNRPFPEETLTAPVAAGRSSRSTWLMRAAVGLLFAAVLIPATLYFERVPEAQPEIRFEIPAAGVISQSLAISPDGQRIAYMTVTNGRRGVWVRPIGSVEAQLLPQTENVANLLGWAPDSRRLAFFADGKLQKIDISGGSPITLADANIYAPGAWNRNGDILFSSALKGTPLIVHVSESGGEVTTLTTPDPAAMEIAHSAPFFLPDGRRFLYLVTRATSSQSNEVALQGASLDSKSTERMGILGLDNPNQLSSPPAYVQPGYLVYTISGSLMAQRLSADGRIARSEPIRLAENIAGFSASERLLVYRQGLDTRAPQSAASRLVWFDRNGKEDVAAGASADYLSVDLSPDDRRALLIKNDMTTVFGLDLWVMDLNRGGQDRLTSNPGVDFSPVWSPDGREVVFASQQKAGSVPGFYRRSAISVGGETFISGDATDASLPMDWSSDGKYVVFIRRAAANAPVQNLWYQPLSVDTKPQIYLESQSVKTEAQFSPDGRWLAYTTNESGSFQVVVQSFPDPKISKTVTTRNGGSQPRWRRDGRELFYLAADGKLMSVPVKTGDMFEIGSETALFQTPLTGPTVNFGAGPFRYDVTADGKRFLIIAPVNNNSSASTADTTPITAIFNWSAGLKK
jgi:Tol biopolymer transport system component